MKTATKKTMKGSTQRWINTPVDAELERRIIAAADIEFRKKADMVRVLCREALDARDKAPVARAG